MSFDYSTNPVTMMLTFTKNYIFFKRTSSQLYICKKSNTLQTGRDHKICTIARWRNESISSISAISEFDHQEHMFSFFDFICLLSKAKATCR